MPRYGPLTPAEPPVSHLQVWALSFAPQSKLAVLRGHGEETWATLSGEHPGAIRGVLGQCRLPLRMGCQLQHRVLNVADNLVVLLQQLLQLFDPVL